MTPGKRFLTSDEIRPLAERSDKMGAWLVVHCWGVIALTVAAFTIWPNPLTFLLAVMIIGSRQLGLAILMHEAAHSALFRSRRANELAGEWLCGRPILAELHAYRHYHLTHHRFTQTERDPDLVLSSKFPTSRASLKRKFTRDLNGQTGVRQLAAQVMMSLRLAGDHEAVEAAKADQDLLLAHLAELTALEPQAGEEARLAETRADMQKGEKLSGDLDELRHIWEGSDSPLAALRVAARRLDRIAPEHPLLTEALGALDRAVIEAGEAEDKLSAAAEALVHDPAALDAAETRLFELRAIARKHRCEVDELPAKMREMRSRLESIEGGEAQLDALEAAAKDAGQRYRAEAEALHATRVAAALRLDEAVARELAPLKLDAARFKTAVTELPEERWGAAGMDSVEFLIATNPGADFAPLNKIASGGELSRFILALKVALAEQGGAATVIFDEIDRGVGGAVASAIGERLARLSADGQLLAVTHSPQVAARGRTHYMIAKSSNGTVTKTGVALLDEAGRKEEIARMLSGAEVTPEARAQADRLLEGV